MISSISQIIVPLTSSISSAITSTLNNISHVVTSAFESHNHEIDLFPEVSRERSRSRALDHIINTESVPVETNQSKLVSLSSIENNCALINTNNCAFNNPEIENFHSDVLKDSNVNDNSHSINNELHTHTVHALVLQPWAVASSAGSFIMYNLS